MDYNDEAIDLDWSSEPEDFPAVEAVSEETGEEDNDETSTERISETEDSDSYASGEKGDSEADEVTGQAEQSKEENNSRERGTPEGDSEKSGEVKSIEDLDDDAKIKVKVDGELQEVTIKEFKNGISGEKAIAKRFSEFDKKEKEFKAELDEINAYVNGFAQKMVDPKEGPVAALEYLTQFTDIPAYEIKDRLIDALLPEIQRRQGLSEEQLHIEKEKHKVDFDKQQYETERQQFESRRAELDLEFKIKNVQQTHGIDESTWEDAFKKLDESLDPSQDITINMVTESVLFDRAEGILKGVNEQLIEQKGIIRDLMQVQQENPDFTIQDLTELVQEVYGDVAKTQAKAELNEVSQKKQNTSQQQKQPQLQQEVQENEPEDWDDLI